VANLIGGWQFNTIGELQSGRPLGMSSNAILLEPDRIKLPKSEQSFAQWFDASTKANPRADGTYAWDVIGSNDYVERLDPHLHVHSPPSAVCS
jgi:hypothetical protein